MASTLDQLCKDGGKLGATKGTSEDFTRHIGHFATSRIKDDYAEVAKATRFLQTHIFVQPDVQDYDSLKTAA